MSEESTTCRECGRALTDPESVKKGIGPVCESRLETVDTSEKRIQEEK